MKVIFLDFDGVLNYEKYVRVHNNGGVIIDPDKMILLKQIIDNTGAKIVLSSSWREHWDKDEALCDNIGTQINEIFNNFNLEIFDKTPILHAKREEEIKLWLNENTQTKNFAVIDDRLMFDSVLDGHIVKTSNFYYGLEESDAEKCIEILNG